MSRLSRVDLRRHDEACALLALDRRLLTEEVVTVIEKWHEGADHANNRNGAFFTPWSLATSFALEVGDGKVLDLCAGIGCLSLAVAVHDENMASGQGITMVEVNPDYCTVARKLLPDAEIINASVFDRGLQAELATRNFGWAISNPPYGAYNAAGGSAPRYKGADCHYAVIDIASDLANAGTFLIPQAATPFRYSGTEMGNFTELPDDSVPNYAAFSRTTGIRFDFNLGIDTSASDKDWRNVKISTEIVVADFRAARDRRENEDMPLFAAAA